ncbi:endonuclease domain-containing 1 protein isoform X2 [Salmo trutta]|uniref:endonuclease domain-containing 1 protein isoform X2 n=1 Tax=Salmo trutta TaxID=8032 RepID=UPI001132927D|nr:endonuclease domain-containing 1 protein-like isoform X2 [Salmo trutta]
MMGVLNHLSTLLLLSLLPPALSRVVEKFSDVPQCKNFFLNGTTPNLPGILVGGTVQDQKRYKLICQLFNNIYRFATLYDTTNRIPVFSAYTFTGPPTDPRPNPTWMIEPQLNGVNNSPEMKNMGEHYQHQAGNYDYSNSIPIKGVNKGHLFPCSHAHDLDTQKSTFTLTNIVPQVVSFNNGRWKEMEENVREKLMTDCFSNNRKIKAYVVTGAVPSKNKTLNNTLKNALNNRVNIPDLMWTAYCCYNNTLNNRVNIPDLMWTAYCCYSNNLGQWVAGAHWSKNVQDTPKKTLNPETLGALEGELNKIYNVGVKVFHDKCQRTVVLSVLEDETGRNLESVEEVKPGRKRVREGIVGRSNKMAKTSGELKECNDEDGCDCDCDEK